MDQIETPFAARIKAQKEAIAQRKKELDAPEPDISAKYPLMAKWCALNRYAKEPKWIPPPKPPVDEFAENEYLYNQIGVLKEKLEKLQKLGSTLEQSCTQFSYQHRSMIPPPGLHDGEEAPHMAELKFYSNALHQHIAWLYWSALEQHVAIETGRHLSQTAHEDVRDIQLWAIKLSLRWGSLDRLALYAFKDIPWHIIKANEELTQVCGLFRRRSIQMFSQPTMDYSRNIIMKHTGEIKDSLKKYEVEFQGVRPIILAIEKILGIDLVEEDTCQDMSVDVEKDLDGTNEDDKDVEEGIGSEEVEESSEDEMTEDDEITDAPISWGFRKYLEKLEEIGDAAVDEEDCNTETDTEDDWDESNV